MRTLTLRFPDDALPTLDTFLKQTKEARVFRRAQAVRDVVKGQRLQHVSDVLQCTYSALRKWVHRFAQEGTHGFVDRPRPGRPAKMTCELEHHLQRLVEQDPLEHASIHSQWSCRELATVLAQQTGVHLGRESIRCALKKQRAGKRLKSLQVPAFQVCEQELSFFFARALRMILRRWRAST